MLLIRCVAILWEWLDLKRSAVVIILILILGAGAYWIQTTGQLQTLLGGASRAQVNAPTAKPGQGGQARRAPSSVEVATSKKDELSDDIAAVGSLLSDKSADIAAETNGRIVEILFADGAEIKAGDVLFRLDDSLLKAQVNEAKARLALAQSVAERNAALVKSKNIAQGVVDESNTQLTLAETALALAEVQLAKLTIRSPFGGRAGFRGVSEGAYVQAGAALVHLEKIDALKAAFSVPELYFAQISVGQTVLVAADAAPGESFEAKIAAIDPLVDVNGRALRIRADLDNAAGKLRPGMLIRVTVRGQTRSAVTVPEAAIVPRSDGAVVFVAAAEKAQETKVQTGKRINGTVEILQGLKEGEQVIVAGNSRLADGAAIAIVPGASN